MAQSIIEESRIARHGWRGLFSKLKKKKVWISLLIILIAGGAYYYFYHQKNAAQTVAVQPQQWKVKKEDIKISVQATGKVVAKDGVELSFPVSGNLEVDNVYVKEGDKVKKGDKIASVKTESLNFELRNAYASYQSALANFNTKKEPATVSEINKAKIAIDQAQVSLDQAKISLEQTKSSTAQSVANAESSLATAENNLKLNTNVTDSEIVNNAYTSLVGTEKSTSISLDRTLRDSDAIIGVDDTMINSNFKGVLGAKDSGTLSSSKASYLAAKEKKLALESALVGIDGSNRTAVDGAAILARQALVAMQNHLYDMQALLEATVTSSDLSQSKLDGFKSTINSNRSSINSAIAALDNSLQSLDNAKNSLSQYQISYNKAVNDLKTAKSQAEQNINNSTISVRSRELSLTQAKNDYADLIAPVNESDLASARSQLTSAAVSVDRAKYNVEQATLISPIDGVVSMLNYKKGDIILDSSTTKVAATIINNDTLFIEANIEEADISKIKVSDKAQVSFDAVDGVNLEGEVSFISLTSETSANGIVTYLVRVILTNTDKAQIREGMTASIEFITASADNVLSVPVAAVHNIGGQPSVEMADKSIANVVTGFTDGKKVEIISGLNEDDMVLY